MKQIILKILCKIGCHNRIDIGNGCKFHICTRCKKGKNLYD